MICDYLSNAALSLVARTLRTNRIADPDLHRGAVEMALQQRLSRRALASIGPFHTRLYAQGVRVLIGCPNDCLNKTLKLNLIGQQQIIDFHIFHRFS